VGIVWSTTNRTRVSDATAVTFSVKRFNLLKLYRLSGNIFRKWFASYFLFIHEHSIIMWSPTVNLIAVTTLLLTFGWDQLLSPSKKYLRRIHIIQHSISYFVWNFHSNSLLFLRSVEENKSCCFFSERSVLHQADKKLFNGLKDSSYSSVTVSPSTAIPVKLRSSRWLLALPPCHYNLYYKCSFVFIARRDTDARYWYSNSACPSVRLSVTFRYQMKTA